MERLRASRGAPRSSTVRFLVKYRQNHGQVYQILQPVLRFLSAIRALIDALPRNLFLVLAMTPQARLRYFAMMPALAGRLQDKLELRPITSLEQATNLYNFYIQHSRERARASERWQGKSQGNCTVFDADDLRDLFVELQKRSSERGTEGVIPRDLLHRLHEKWNELVAMD